MTTVADRFGRPLGSLRLSVTDRCNLRCRYCMPEQDYVWLPRSSILSFEELARLARVFGSLGARKVRLTGGEPLLRHSLDGLVGALAETPDVAEIALTTNGVLLAAMAERLRSSGLDRITVSLDTLDPDRFASFTRSARHAEVMAGIAAQARVGFEGTKLNSVIIRGFNDDEIVPLLEFARERALEIRYIEYMDVGGATGWTMGDVVSRGEMIAAISARYGAVEPVDSESPAAAAAPAERFRLSDGTTFGIIASTTAPFCRTCDRSRVTADGTWLLCLYAAEGVDLRTPMREGASDDELAAIISRTWRSRMDRGAETRAATPGRAALYAIDGLRADPRREMHTRGG